MRIREILFHNFRSFRGERRISFVDPDTDQVRPVTVLAGSNGSGKTTVLEAIETLLAFNIFPLTGPSQNDFLSEVSKSDWVDLTLELTPQDLGETGGSTKMAHLTVDRRSGPLPDKLALQWSLHVVQERSNAGLQGGWLYFPDSNGFCGLGW